MHPSGILGLVPQFGFADPAEAVRLVRSALFTQLIDTTTAPRLPDEVLLPLWKSHDVSRRMPSHPFGLQDAEVLDRAFGLNGLCLIASRAVWFLTGGAEIGGLQVVRSALAVPAAPSRGGTPPLIGHYWLENAAGERWDATWEQAEVWPELREGGQLVRHPMGSRFGSARFELGGIGWRCSRLEFEVATYALYLWRSGR